MVRQYRKNFAGERQCQNRPQQFTVISSQVSSGEKSAFRHKAKKQISRFTRNDSGVNRRNAIISDCLNY